LGKCGKRGVVFIQERATMTDDLKEQERRDLRAIFVESGHRTLNALLLVCGGTAVSFLTFMGTAFKEVSLVERVGAEATRGFVLALQAFVLSVAVCMLAYGTTYLGHAFYHLKYDKLGVLMMFLTILLGFSSLFAFVFGSLSAVDAFQLALGALTRAGAR